MARKLHPLTKPLNRSVRPLIILFLALGGALGTLARFGAGSLVQSWTGYGFPWGTLAINLGGSFLLGLIIALTDRSVVSPEMRIILGVGFCGAFTTFSTFSVETLALMQEGQTGRALIYVAASVLSGLLAASVGIRLGS